MKHSVIDIDVRQKTMNFSNWIVASGSLTNAGN